MSIYILVVTAFLVSLFVGTHAVCLGLGIAVAILSIVILLDEMGFLD